MSEEQKLVVFFGCSMRGGQEKVSREDLAKIPAIIEELGYVVPSRHQTQAGIIAQENQFETWQIHDRDYQNILASHAGVFEITNPSLGAGGEISDMLHEGKPVLCLFQGDENDISAYIRGKADSGLTKAYLECASYTTLEEAKEIIARFLEKVQRQMA